jgi:hypothetical protein
MITTALIREYDAIIVRISTGNKDNDDILIKWLLITSMENATGDPCFGVATADNRSDAAADAATADAVGTVVDQERQHEGGVGQVRRWRKSGIIPFMNVFTVFTGSGGADGSNDTRRVAVRADSSNDTRRVAGCSAAFFLEPAVPIIILINQSISNIRAHINQHHVRAKEKRRKHNNEINTDMYNSETVK